MRKPSDQNNDICSSDALNMDTLNSCNIRINPATQRRFYDTHGSIF